MDFHSCFICDIEMPLEAYRLYIAQSYELILDIKNKESITSEFLKTADDYERESFYTSPDSWKSDMNNEILTIWHSSIFLSLCSFMEKWMKLWCEMHYKYHYPKWWKYSKQIGTFFKENKTKNKSKDLVIHYNFIFKKLGLVNESEAFTKDMELMTKYYGIRNLIVHEEEYQIDTEIYTKDFLIGMSYEIRDFLKYLFYWEYNPDALNWILD